MYFTCREAALSSPVDSELTVKFVDRAIRHRLIGTVDERVAAPLHQDRGARQIVVLEELPEGTLVTIRRQVAQDRKSVV